MNESMEHQRKIRFSGLHEYNSVKAPLTGCIEFESSDNILSGDWIGLFIVGWSSLNQCKVKIQVPDDGQFSVPSNFILLPCFIEFSTFSSGDCLSDVSSEYYQLCYFDRHDNLVAISSIFSFIDVVGTL